MDIYKTKEILRNRKNFFRFFNVKKILRFIHVQACMDIMASIQVFSILQKEHPADYSAYAELAQDLLFKRLKAIGSSKIRKR